MATKASGLRISNKVLFFGVTFLFGSFLLVCCKKNDPWDQAFRNGWSEMDSISDWSFFPPNITTWIYEDSVTGALDTVSLVQLSVDTTEVYYAQKPDLLYYTKVEKTLELYSSRFNHRIYYWSTVGSPFVSTGSTISKRINFGGYTFAHTPLAKKFKHWTLHGDSGVMEFHNSYTVSDVVYSNVAEIEQLGEPGFDGEHTRYFFAPNHGLIKCINYHQNQVWQLKAVY